MKSKVKYQFLIFLLIILYACKENDSTGHVHESIAEVQIPKKQDEQIKTYKPSNKFDHINHIRENSRTGQLDGVDHNPKYFVDYVIENLLEQKQHRKYITDRKLLRKLNNKVCWDNYVSIVDTLLNGDKIEIEIENQDFDTINRTLIYHNKSNFLIEIDGKNPFGAVYSKQPNKEIKSLSIEINGRLLQTSIDKYQNLYEPEFCNFGSYQKITEAYEDGDNIYIYIFGGNAADSYFAKLIFDKTSGYITSIIADYGPLSDYGSFGDHFIGI